LGEALYRYLLEAEQQGVEPGQKGHLGNNFGGDEGRWLFLLQCQRAKAKNKDCSDVRAKVCVFIGDIY
jgi:hypothetical protein